MLPRLVVAALVKNESSKFFPSALSAWSKFADDILILDDQSTDGTAQTAIDFGATVAFRNGVTAWGAEAPARAELWDFAMRHTSYGDWILILDADMCPAKDPRELAFGGHSGGWAFPLYDLWNLDPLRYRWDDFWYGHTAPRVWMVRRPYDREWLWPEQGIHCGHLPLNIEFERGVGRAPLDHALLHYAYGSPELRVRKYHQYMSVAPILDLQQRRHAESIIDPDPKTYPLEFTPDYVLELARPNLDAA